MSSPSLPFSYGGSSLHFVLWQSAATEGGQQLALYPEAPSDNVVVPALARWVLPGHHQRQLSQHSHSLLEEACDLPPVTRLLDAGQCVLITGVLPLQTGQEQLSFYFEDDTCAATSPCCGFERVVPAGFSVRFSSHPVGPAAGRSWLPRWHRRRISAG